MRRVKSRCRAYKTILSVPVNEDECECIFTDGGVRTGGVNGPTGGKTGRGAVGYVIRDAADKVVLDKGGMLLEGDVSVNQAEYGNGTADAPVMMADFTRKRLGDIQPGDQVIGWARPEVGNRRLVRADVLATQRRVAQLVNVRLVSGTAVVSEVDHQWAVGDSYARPTLVFRTPKQRRRMLRLFANVPPLDRDLDAVAGYLGGIYDGEASRRRIAQWREANPVTHAAIEEALVALDMPFSKNDSGFSIVGGRDEFLRFVMWCQPRKITRGGRWINNHILPATMTPDEIVCIEDAGEGEIIDLQTLTGNYTAWGYGTKACDLGFPMQTLN